MPRSFRSAFVIAVAGLTALSACSVRVLDDDEFDAVTATSAPASSSPSSSPGTVTGEGSTATTTAPEGTVVPTIDWEDCGRRLECGVLEVPLDHDDPSTGTLRLAVTRRLAEDGDDRIGSLLANPGGPGFGGQILAEEAELYFASDLLERFDIVGWDPRGTGDSEPAVDCIDDYDDHFGYDIPPDPGDELEAFVTRARTFVEACQQQAGDLLLHISTEDSARDMDLLRQALGEEQISYFGFSYGSELGATWATLFPDTVRAAVLDGAADPTADALEGVLQQAAGFESQLDTFLAACSADRECAFHSGGRAESAYDALMTQLGDTPLIVSADRIPVSRGVAYTAVASALYGDFLWPRLERALADARDGDGRGLLELHDDYFQRRSDGSYGDELEAFLAISCLDDPGPVGVDAVLATVERFEAVAPRLGAGFAYGFECALWPVPSPGRVTITGAGAGPIVVIGTTGDAATPIESSRMMADTLQDGRFVIVEANRHTGYGVNRCIIDLVGDYLIDLDAPADETYCD